MDLNRTFLAVALSIIILLGWQYLFPPPPPPELPQEDTDNRIVDATVTADTGEEGE